MLISISFSPLVSIFVSVLVSLTITRNVFVIFVFVVVDEKNTAAGGVTEGGDVQSKVASTTESTVVVSSEVARQKKRDSMLFGDADEPPLIVAQSDTALSTSSASVGSGELMMPGRTVSEPLVSQTTSSSSSRESFVRRSDEAVHGSAWPRHSGTDVIRQTVTLTRHGHESSGLYHLAL